MMKQILNKTLICIVSASIFFRCSSNTTKNMTYDNFRKVEENLIHGDQLEIEIEDEGIKKGEYVSHNKTHLTIKKIKSENTSSVSINDIFSITNSTKGESWDKNGNLIVNDEDQKQNEIEIDLNKNENIDMDFDKTCEKFKSLIDLRKVADNAPYEFKKHITSLLANKNLSNFKTKNDILGYIMKKWFEKFCDTTSYYSFFTKKEDASDSLFYLCCNFAGNLYKNNNQTFELDYFLDAYENKIRDIQFFEKVSRVQREDLFNKLPFNSLDKNKFSFWNKYIFSFFIVENDSLPFQDLSGNAYLGGRKIPGLLPNSKIFIDKK